MTGVKIDFQKLGQAELDSACRTIDECVRLLFRQPGIEEEFNEFLKTYIPPEKSSKSSKNGK